MYVIFSFVFFRCYFFFFFQAEDGIRDLTVTGVQTCALPIFSGGNIEPRGLEEEMRSAYLDYAMSVIVGRALPDVRDGLKPVHRRVLHVMNEMGLRAPRRHVKCAQIVGEVMGKYHPHGDTAIYDTLVR